MGQEASRFDLLDSHLHQAAEFLALLLSDGRTVDLKKESRRTLNLLSLFLFFFGLWPSADALNAPNHVQLFSEIRINGLDGTEVQAIGQKGWGTG